MGMVDRPGTPTLQCLCELLRNFGRRIREIANKLPIRTREQEDEDDVDEQKKEISATANQQRALPAINISAYFFMSEYSIQLLAR